MTDPAATRPPRDEVEQHRMTLGEHLEELRSRLLRSLVAVGVVFLVAWGFRDRVVAFALAPYEQKARVWLNEELYTRRVAELEALETELRADLGVAGEADPAAAARVEERLAARREALFLDGEVSAGKMREPVPSMRADDGVSTFFFYMKVCGYAALFVAGPYVLWQVWAFVAAGLYRSERRVVHRYFPLSLGLFLGGVTLGYTMMVPYGYYFLTELGLNQIRHEALVTPWLSFLNTLLFGLGVVFQLPLVMMAAARLELVDPADFGRYRGHFWVGAFVLAAFFTPPDPYTQAMMAVPMTLLYEVGILLARRAARAAAASTDLTVAP